MARYNNRRRVCPSGVLLSAFAGVSVMWVTGLSSQAEASPSASGIVNPVKPLVMVILDTSGSMEWVPGQDDVYPCCVFKGGSGGDEVNKAYREDQCNDYKYSGGFNEANGRNKALSLIENASDIYPFAKSRHVIAKEVLTGRLDGFYCINVDRDKNKFNFDIDNDGFDDSPQNYNPDNRYPLMNNEPRSERRLSCASSSSPVAPVWAPRAALRWTANSRRPRR